MRLEWHTKGLIQVIEDLFGRSAQLVGAEVGVWRGENSEQLLSYFPSLYLWMVDRYQVLSPSEAWKDPRMGKFIKSDFEEAFKMSAARTEFASDRRCLLTLPSIAAASRVPNQSLHFVFIDASHDYDSVVSDLRSWELKVRPGGIMSGHDYHGVGDRKGAFGVKRAVDQYLKSTGRQLHQSLGKTWWCEI